MLQAAIAISVFVYGILSGTHALLHKRDPRSTLGWMVLCVLLPIVGATLYWMVGNNRIRTRARMWQARGLFTLDQSPSYGRATAELEKLYPSWAETMRGLLNISERVTDAPLLHGNKVQPLYNGEQAYPPMLQAIESARTSVYLSTYLFGTDEAGRSFIDALGAAAARGVDVRVLLDAIGERYSRPRAGKLLRRRVGVKVGRFLPLAPTLRGLRVNLRNHRKLLVVDHEIGFTGGMNIGQRHLVEAENNKKRTADIHFRVSGPVVRSMETVFLEDWHFVTGDDFDFTQLEPIEPVGDSICRGISDGPNEDFETLQWIIVGALSCARESVRIMTPYFIPGRELLSALNAASLRGVAVDIILPQKNNLPYVAWAADAMLWELLQYGVRIHFQPGPFNHSKILIVDEFYVLLGSANLDPRSLRLNFEFNLEVYDPELARTLSAELMRVRSRSHELTEEELRARPFAIRLRNSVAKLFSPYL